MDKCLPFGLRSAPFLFDMVADALEWILCYNFNQQYYLHYLDDFFFADSMQSDVCLVTLMDMIRFSCSPYKTRKGGRPHNMLTTAWHTTDIVQQVAQLPKDKLRALVSELGM